MQENAPGRIHPEPCIHLHANGQSDGPYPDVAEVFQLPLGQLCMTEINSLVSRFMHGD